METKESRETKNKRRDSFFVSMIGTRAASSIRADFSAMGMDPNFFFEVDKICVPNDANLKNFFNCFL